MHYQAIHTQAPVTKAQINSVLDRVVRGFNGQFDRKTVVIAPTFADLPSPIVAYANENGYDNNNKKGKISGVAYKGKIYLVQENIHNELSIEENILHERMHLLLRAKGTDSLTQSMNALFMKMGGFKGLQAMANEYKFSFKPYAEQAAGMQYEQRVTLYVEEFIAGIEGKRAYAKLPQRIKQSLRVFVGKVRKWLVDKGFTEIAKKLNVDLTKFGLSDLAYFMKQVREGAEVGNDGEIRFNRSQQNNVWGSPEWAGRVLSPASRLVQPRASELVTQQNAPLSRQPLRNQSSKLDVKDLETASQAKSAVGNNGNFDPNDDDIRFNISSDAGTYDTKGGFGEDFNNAGKAKGNAKAIKPRIAPSATAPKQDNLQPEWEDIGQESLFKDLTRKYQNKLADLKEVTDSIKATGTKQTDSIIKTIFYSN